MTLPRLLLLTDRTQCRGRLVDVVWAAVEGGVRAVVLREKDLPHRERRIVADRLRAPLAAVGGLLLVASDASIPADGVHLAATDPAPPEGPGVVGRSCHRRDEVAVAAAAGCTYATLSPVFPTPSKPGYGPPLGPRALGGLPLPTFALGGVTPFNAADCMAAGAHGIAVMGTVMRARDPAGVAAALGQAVSGEVVR